MGIEPTYPAWKAGVLPLNYTRKKQYTIYSSHERNVLYHRFLRLSMVNFHYLHNLHDLLYFDFLNGIECTVIL